MDEVVYAVDFFELDVSTEAVGRLFRLEPVACEFADALREVVDVDATADDLDGIGDPIGGRISPGCRGVVRRLQHRPLSRAPATTE